MQNAIELDSKAIVLEALHRLLESADLGDSERQRNMLRYLVTEEVEGRGTAIKAFRIAMDVLGRGADFDPQTDSIVRTEIGRLRKTLTLHFATHGADEPIVIDIPTGSYRPVFVRRDLAPTSAPGDIPSSTTRVRHLAFLPWLAGLVLFSCLLAGGNLLWSRLTMEKTAFVRLGILNPKISFEQSYSYLDVGLRLEIASLLSRESELAVSPVDVMPAPDAPSRFNYFVSSSIQVMDMKALIQVVLLDGTDQHVIADVRHEVAIKVSSPREIQTLLAERIALTVSNPYGVVYGQFMKQAKVGPRNEVNCYFLALQHMVTHSLKDLHIASRCLLDLPNQAHLSEHVRAAKAFVALLRTRYGDDARSWEEAKVAFATEAAITGKAASRQWLVSIGQYTSALCDGDARLFVELGEKALQRKLPNPVIFNDYGRNLALGIGQMEKARRVLVKEPFLIQERDQAMPIVNLADALLLGSATTDLLALIRVDLMVLPENALLIIAAAQQSGDKAVIARARAALKWYDIVSLPAAMAVLGRSCWSPHLIDVLKPLLERSWS